MPAPLLEMPPARRIATNGITLSVHEAGPKDGLPVVFSHGWPEIAFSWRHQIKALAAAGYRVIAPDQRGFGASDAPAPVEAYDAFALTADLAGLLDALGLKKAAFIGHDWGGALVWYMGLLQPDRVIGIASLNTPFAPRPPADPIELYKKIYVEDFYIVWFQTPGEPEALWEKDVDRTFRFFLRSSDTTAEAFAELPKERKSLALQKAFAAPEERWGGGPFLSPAEMKVFADTYRASGFRGGLNWYRNITRTWKLTDHVRQHIPHPGLMVTAGRDVVLTPKMTEGMETYIPKLARAHVEDSGHWTQQEAPETVNRILIDWLATLPRG
ncbi:MAG: alpha/beta hydrolase [Alphaproteobacteria bacterium]|nr:alpha/beta hydrolase [Alphaproteobacteria bacterium]